MSRFWTVCEHPERQADEWAMFDVTPPCQPCAIAATAALAHPDVPQGVRRAASHALWAWENRLA